MSDKDSLIELVNQLVNQPQNLEAMAPGYTDVDLTGFVENPNNLVIGNEMGVGLFALLPNADHVYEGHYLFDRETHGKTALELSRKILDIAFTKYPVKAIVGLTPVDNKAARAHSHALGFAPIGDSVDTIGRSCVVVRMEREQWDHLSADSSVA